MKHIAIVDDEEVFRGIVTEFCELMGHKAYAFESGQKFLEAARSKSFDAVLCDQHLGKSFGLDVLRDFIRISAPNRACGFVFMTGANNADFIEKAVKLRRVCLLRKPFTEAELAAVLELAWTNSNSVLADIFESVHAVTGVRLGQDSQAGLESRILRRARVKGFSDLAEYFHYFNANREVEMEAALGLLTTHTTSFFREPEHFRTLESEVLPALVKARAADRQKSVNLAADAQLPGQSRPLNIWSAACSTGQEVYSLVITCAEFLPSICGVHGHPELDFRITGTDIDRFSVETAKEGIYSSEEMEGVVQGFRQKYFLQGSADLAGFFKVKDSIWKKCSFKKHNLLDETSAVDQCDIVFLRNVLIYFSEEDINKIVNGLVEIISSGGYLFVGHTESGAISHPLLKLKRTGVFERLAETGVQRGARIALNNFASASGGALNDRESPKVLQLQRAKELGELICKLIVVGSSTGGTQALRHAFAYLKNGAFPSVLVTQHFPEGFTQAFARNLANDLEE